MKSINYNGKILNVIYGIVRLTDLILEAKQYLIPPLEFRFILYKSDPILYLVCNL